MEHIYSNNAEYNFTTLERRILDINSPEYGKYNEVRMMLKSIIKNNNPSLIMATGGSKTVAYFLQLILEENGVICEVVEPRDFTHKKNINSYSNLIVISASGNTNGIDVALNNFRGNKFLLTEKEKSGDFEVITWGNSNAERERSFISLATSLGPISLFLDSVYLLDKDISKEDVSKVNDKIKELLKKSKERVDRLTTNFKNIPLVQAISGYENRCSAETLESNLVETGTIPIIMHDKSSFCHGRSNLIYRNPNSSIIYLIDEENELDKLLIELLSNEYPNFNVFKGEENDKYFREFSLLLQMYYLSKKIAEEKGVDLTQPDYNPNIVKKVYTYRGKM